VRQVGYLQGLDSCPLVMSILTVPHLGFNITLYIRNATSGINDGKALREHLKSNMAIQSASGTQMNSRTETIAKTCVVIHKYDKASCHWK